MDLESNLSQLNFSEDNDVNKTYEALLRDHDRSLHGNGDLSEGQNINIFKAVHNFITKSNHFNLA